LAIYFHTFLLFLEEILIGYLLSHFPPIFGGTFNWLLHTFLLFKKIVTYLNAFSYFRRNYELVGMVISVELCVKVIALKELTNRSSQVERMEESRIAFKILTGKSMGKRPLGRPRYRLEYNINI
jgi:hypothetical protein